MISDDRLVVIAAKGRESIFPVTPGDCSEMAKELLTLRKAFSKPVGTFTHCTATGRDVWIQTKGGEPLYRGPK